MFTRRAILAGGATGLATMPLLAGSTGTIKLGLPSGPDERMTAAAYADKRDMIVQRVRPPLLETPMAVFDDGIITPNDRFFVRWSGGVMPTSIDPEAFRLTLRGAVRTPVQLTLAEVARAGDRVEVMAINQCAGNSRGYSDPRVTGAQWGHGAMGNAVWRGVRLKDLLERAGLSRNAKRVRFAGLDTPMIDGSPQTIKSLPIDIALRDDVIVAWGMNGEMLPLLNGYPLRLVVPGWFATYWIKMLSDIEVLSTDEDDSYFMAKTYRMPTVPVKPGDKDFPTVPISTMVPRSFITSHANGGVVGRGVPIDLRGIAMGGDCGVARVDVLAGGRSYRAVLGPDEGEHGFRRWSVTLPSISGPVGSRCTNAKGVTQPMEPSWNPSGYARNCVEMIGLTAA